MEESGQRAEAATTECAGENQERPDNGEHRSGFGRRSLSYALTVHVSVLYEVLGVDRCGSAGCGEGERAE
jgi:hypothetical protein